MRAASPILKYGLSGIPDGRSGTETRLGTAKTREVLTIVFDLHRRHRRGDVGSIVQRVLEHLTWFESQHPPCADRDLLPGLRVAPSARVLVAHDEVPESGDLDLLTPFKGA